MSDLLEGHEILLWSLTGLGLFTFFATLLMVPVLVTRMPVDYFSRRPIRDWPARHPAVHLLLVFLKNMLGLVLVLAGLAMLVLPGQGLLTMVIGITLLDFPGKRRLELWLIRRPVIFRAANWLRRRRGRPPLQLPARDGHSG